MRLIDAEALKKRIMLAPNKNEETWDELYDSIIFEIDNAPTVEPEKVTEGELVKAYTKGFDAGVETVRPQGEWIIQDIVHCLQYCSECRTYSEFKWNFCTNCGAELRKGGAK